MRYADPSCHSMIIRDRTHVIHLLRQFADSICNNLDEIDQELSAGEMLEKFIHDPRD